MIFSTWALSARAWTPGSSASSRAADTMPHVRFAPRHRLLARGRFLATAGPPIFTLTYAQLQSYDVGRLRPGSAYAARFPQQQPVDGERIPRLADVLTLVRTRGRGRVRVAVEVKTFPEQPELTLAPDPFVQALRLDVERTGTGALVVVLAFDWRVLSAVQRLMPQVATAALT